MLRDILEAPPLYRAPEPIIVGSTKLLCYDIGGYAAPRLYRSYLEVADALIYVVDAADRERLDESATEFAVCTISSS